MNGLALLEPPAAAAAAAIAAVVCAALVGCGGGGGGGDDDGPVTGNAPPAGPTLAQRSAAATATAQSANNACAAARPFYWEIGDKDGALASGSVAGGSDPTVYTASTAMPIASASKWIYASYVVEKRAGALTPADVSFLTFRSGYVSFSICLRDQTVQQCVDFANNGAYTASADGFFSYGGGHMEKHASLNGLGALDNDALAAGIRSAVGSDVGLAYSQPQLAGGGVTSAADYARLLRRILSGSLRMKAALGTSAVCTNPRTCSAALSAPVPASESWHYSIGHWVEDDPLVGDGAFSSAGAFGFYPWIDAAKASYGVLARHDTSEGAAFRSVYCGRAVRQAWQSASAVSP